MTSLVCLQIDPVSMLLWFYLKRKDQSYSRVGLINIFDMILSADEFDTTSPDHRGLYQLSDLAKMIELFDSKIQHIP